MYNPTLAKSFVLTGGRILGQVIIETISLRHGISGGLLLLGGPGILIIYEEIAEMEKRFFGKSEIPIVKNVESFLLFTEVPPADAVDFITAMAKNQKGTKYSIAEPAYKRQYLKSQDENGIFKDRFPDNWDEFLSYIRLLILDYSNKKI